jgi:hypothetical protein
MRKRITLALLYVFLIPSLNSQCTEVTDFEVTELEIGNNNCNYTFDVSYNADFENTSIVVQIFCGSTTFENKTCTGVLNQGVGTITYGTYTTICCEDEVTFNYSSHTNNYCGGFVCYSSLPVKLSNFTVIPVGKHMQVRWATESEINNDYFEIEYSEDGRNFSPVKRIAGQGLSLEATEYMEYVDFDPSRKTHYYRLSQTDYDGAKTQSDVLIVTIATDKLSLSPNPTDGPITFNQDIEGELIISNINGAEVDRYYLDQPINQLNLEHLSAGVYFLYIEKTGQNLKIILN